MSSANHSYKVSEQDIADYYRLGYIIFRRLLPASLIGDLRREAEKGLAIARNKLGPSAQRLQPVHDHEGELDLRPFRDYSELPALREALDQVFTPEHFVGGLKHHLGILYNPSDIPWTMSWHRDITLEKSRLEPEEFASLMLDWDAANQINCPLYEDSCTWFVPGSNLRTRDLPGELAVNSNPGSTRQMDLSAKSPITDPVEKELYCHEYVRSMPGAVQFHLEPGDMAIYRPFGWHLGSYVPYKKRATIHDTLLTERFAQWHKEWSAGGSPRWLKESVSA
jgi:hypothetical protein